MLVSCNPTDDDNQKSYSGKDFIMFLNTVSNVSVSEDAGSYEFEVGLSKAQNTDVTVTVTKTDDTAIEGTNYELPSSLVIPAGETSAVLLLTIIDDTDLNATRKFSFELSTDSGVTVGLAEEGSYKKEVSIVNEDCPTKFSYWLGSLSVEDVGYGSTSGTGSANSAGDCDILVVDNDLPGVAGNAVAGTLNTEYEVYFTPTNPDGSVGTVVVNSTYSADVVSGGVTYEAKYEGTGTYSTVTGEVVINYVLGAYSGGNYVGSFWSGTTILTLD